MITPQAARAGVESGTTMRTYPAPHHVHRNGNDHWPATERLVPAILKDTTGLPMALQQSTL
ncbi:MAG: hypothetical protein EP318_18390 [Rhodobacteraceae bacterium]|nr:MAG: hypothetical protein EP318_18390 [Paracoccaceae bacterium]